MMRRPAGSEKRGWTPAPDDHLPIPGGQPPALAARIHGGRSDAGRRLVDELVPARIVAAAGCPGHTPQPTDHSPPASETGNGAPHGAGEEDDWAASRPPWPGREHLPVSA